MLSQLFSPITTIKQIIGIDVIPGLLLVQGAIFLLVMWFLNKILFKPILKILQEREEKTEGFLIEADEIRKKTDITFQEYQTRFSRAKKEALEIKKNLVLKGNDQKEAILNQAKKEAQNYLEELREKVAQEAMATREVLRQQIEFLGKMIAEKALGRSL